VAAAAQDLAAPGCCSSDWRSIAAVAPGARGRVGHRQPIALRLGAFVIDNLPQPNAYDGR